MNILIRKTYGSILRVILFGAILISTQTEDGMTDASWDTLAELLDGTRSL